MSNVLKSRQIPVALTSLCGIIIVIAYFIDVPIVQDVADTITAWAVVLLATATVVGAIFLGRFMLTMAQRRIANWPLMIWAVIIMIVTIVVGLMPPMAINDNIEWIQFNMNAPLGQMFYGMLGCWIVSASYRSLKCKNLEAIVLLLAAFSTILLNIGLHEQTGEWFKTIPMAAGMRSIIMGSALGTIASGIKTILGRERGMASGGEG